MKHSKSHLTNIDELLLRTPLFRHFGRSLLCFRSSPNTEEKRFVRN